MIVCTITSAINADVVSTEARASSRIRENSYSALTTSVNDGNVGEVQVLRRFCVADEQSDRAVDLLKVLDQVIRREFEMKS